MTDALDIPAFLRRPLTPAAAARMARIVAELRTPTLNLRPYDPAADWSRPKGVSAEDWAARKAEANARSLQRLKNCVPKAKRFGALPPDYSRETHRWDPRRGKFVRDAHVTKLASGLVINAPAAAPVAVAAPAVTSARAKRPDPFADVVARVRGLPPPKFKEFALANGCWDGRYAELPAGLQRMNVVNRLRAKLRKGHSVKW